MGKTKFEGLPKSVPETEFSEDFIQGMADRMAVSYFKYGAAPEAYPNKVNAIESLRKRLAKYESTKNLEWLIDVANFAMIEFMYPSLNKAYYKPTDSDKSPGRMWHGDIDPSQHRNEEF